MLSGGAASRLRRPGGCGEVIEWAVPSAMPIAQRVRVATSAVIAMRAVRAVDHRLVLGGPVLVDPVRYLLAHGSNDTAGFPQARGPHEHRHPGTQHRRPGADQGAGVGQLALA